MIEIGQSVEQCLWFFQENLSCTLEGRCLRCRSAPTLQSREPCLRSPLHHMSVPALKRSRLGLQLRKPRMRQRMAGSSSRWVGFVFLFFLTKKILLSIEASYEAQYAENCTYLRISKFTEFQRLKTPMQAGTGSGTDLYPGSSLSVIPAPHPCGTTALTSGSSWFTCFVLYEWSRVYVSCGCRFPPVFSC